LNAEEGLQITIVRQRENMSNLLVKTRIWADIELKRISRRPFKKFISPFESKETASLIIHCCYHRVGTVWFTRILRDIAAEFGLSFQAGRQAELSSDTDVFLQGNSRVELDKLPTYVGSHMIRDPRDAIISGYFYHLWTKEEWAYIPMDKFGGKSYQEHLNSVGQDEGLSAEIKRAERWIPYMVNWNYKNPLIFEIRYEDIISDEETFFRKLFEHYGFKKSAVERSCQIASKYSFSNMTKRRIGEVRKGTHLRSGRSGEWKKIFKSEHKKLFKELYPGVLVAIGYEANDDW
jgi:hypothetical protein